MDIDFNNLLGTFPGFMGMVFVKIQLLVSFLACPDLWV